jgi:hypothetical protein
MASPAVSTPSSAGSPQNIAPAPPTLAIKSTIAARMASITPNAPGSVTAIGPTKEWILPPRPKPGRKPATDTPPTKRKAQNRAAQRAFRERRAARVGELEEQLKETEEDRQKREKAMRDQINDQNDQIARLEAEVQRFSDETRAWHNRYIDMERKLSFEKQEKEAVINELGYLRNGARSRGTDAVPLPPRRQQKSRPPAVSQSNNQNTSIIEPLGCGGCTTTSNCVCVETAMDIAASGCGGCTSTTSCACLEETLKGPNIESTHILDHKRPRSPHQDTYDNKRLRHSVEQIPLEVDFTQQFASKPAHTEQKSSQDILNLLNPQSRSGAESCGFCDEGTYCVCAEAALASEREAENRLAPLLNEVTPPPSDTDVTIPDSNPLKLPSLYPNHRMHHALKPVIAPTENPCANGPGSCRQCQEDPKSGLFCRSLAAMRASSSSSSELPSGCCGGASSGGGCCKSIQTLPAAAEPSLSCAETYKTLASHRNFEQASDDLGNWLPKLHAATPRYPGRAPLDIEAASVMNVIKYFDVRFGRD